MKIREKYIHVCAVLNDLGSAVFVRYVTQLIKIYLSYCLTVK